MAVSRQLTVYTKFRTPSTVNEFRSELPLVEKLLLAMKPSKKERTSHEGYVYTTDSLLKKINTIREQGQFRFAAGEIGDSKHLAAFMYKINFLTARKASSSSDGVVRKYFEENRYLSNEFVDFGFDWEIHPAYRWALQPDNLSAIFASLSLTAD